MALTISRHFGGSRVYLVPAEHVNLEVVMPVDSSPLIVTAVSLRNLAATATK